MHFLENDTLSSKLPGSRGIRMGKVWDFQKNLKGLEYATNKLYLLFNNSNNWVKKTHKDGFHMLKNTNTQR